VIEKLQSIEKSILDAIKEAEELEPHDRYWLDFVGHLDSAKVSLWHAMDSIPA